MLFRFRLSIENVDNYAALPAEIPITFISVVGGKVELLLCQRVIKCTWLIIKVFYFTATFSVMFAKKPCSPPLRFQIEDGVLTNCYIFAVIQMESATKIQTAFQLDSVI